MAYENAEQVKEALEKLRELSADRALVDLMNSQDMYECDQISKREASKEQGREEGREEGILLNKKENAKKMKKLGMKLEDIIEVTGLTKEEIEAID